MTAVDDALIARPNAHPGVLPTVSMSATAARDHRLASLDWCRLLASFGVVWFHLGPMAGRQFAYPDMRDIYSPRRCGA